VQLEFLKFSRSFRWIEGERAKEGARFYARKIAAHLALEELPGRAAEHSHLSSAELEERLHAVGLFYILSLLHSNRYIVHALEDAYHLEWVNSRFGGSNPDLIMVVCQTLFYAFLFHEDRLWNCPIFRWRDHNKYIKIYSLRLNYNWNILWQICTMQDTPSPTAVM
jgi:hypothetical protein